MSLPARTPTSLPLWSFVLLMAGANYWAYTADIATGTLPEGPLPEASQPGPEPDSTAPMLQGPAPSDLTETLARPLFLAERRPVPPPIAAGAPDAGPSSAPLDIELAGTMQTGEAGMALIRTPEKREGQWVKTGGQIGPWTILAVRADGATLERDGMRTELRLKPAGENGTSRPPAP